MAREYKVKMNRLLMIDKAIQTPYSYCCFILTVSNSRGYTQPFYSQYLDNTYISDTRKIR